MADEATFVDPLEGCDADADYYLGAYGVNADDAMRSMADAYPDWLPKSTAGWAMWVLKYLWRFPRKHEDPAEMVKDLDKAVSYIERVREDVIRVRGGSR